MKIWFDEIDVNFNSFTSEQFLLLPLFKDEVINKYNDFKDSSWKRNIESFITFTSIEECDIVLYPKKFDKGIVHYLEISQKYNKIVYAFYNDDNSSPVQNFNNLKLFRTSLYKSKKKSNEHALPAWSQDLLKENLIYRKKLKDPIVSFCGYLSNPIRSTALNILNRNPYIIKNFIIRSAFWGGNPHNPNIRKEYIDSVNNSDFVLCCRGAGNFSYRLYETMSCGRIPIIVDTDCAFPCEDKIQWESIGLIVKDIDNINELLNTFWQSLTEEEYIYRQAIIRQTYKNFIAPDGFAQYLRYNI